MLRSAWNSFFFFSRIFSSLSRVRFFILCGLHWFRCYSCLLFEATCAIKFEHHFNCYIVHYLFYYYFSCSCYFRASLFFHGASTNERSVSFLQCSLKTSVSVIARNGGKKVDYKPHNRKELKRKTKYVTLYMLTSELKRIANKSNATDTSMIMMMTMATTSNSLQLQEPKPIQEKKKREKEVNIESHTECREQRGRESTKNGNHKNRYMLK